MTRPTVLVVSEDVNVLSLLAPLGKACELKYLVTENRVLAGHPEAARLGLSAMSWPEVNPADLLFNCLATGLLDDKQLALGSVLRLNLHFGPLPEYAGTFPYCWAIINGISEYAVTLHHLEAAVDAGPIVDVEWFSLADDATAYGVYYSCLRAARRLCERLAERLTSGTPPDSRGQDLRRRHVYRRRDLEEFALDTSWDWERFMRGWRALDFRPATSPFGGWRVATRQGTLLLARGKVLRGDNVLAPGTCELEGTTICIGGNGFWLEGELAC